MTLTLPPKLPRALKEALASLYDDLATAQRSISVSCHQCGACCNFAEYDHELWVTNLELAYLIETEGSRAAAGTGVCPYLQNNQCIARIGRALGCRIFLCEQHAIQMETLHEAYFDRLRALAEEYDVDLEYGEFLKSLGELKE
ncbi:MAG: hypothetical protein JXX14_13595 [Deltaproteobacteria bacterium]|nr:hypothetical protein [Deltaproteobacteria bacterium]